MRVSRALWIQFGVFVTVSAVSITVMCLGFLKLPSLWFGVGRYTITVELPEAAGLYERANVTYRGTQIGKVESVGLTGQGVDAVLSLNDGYRVPADVTAEVHSQTAVGEQYVALVPRNPQGPTLKNGDVITRAHSSVPPDVNTLLNAANRGLLAIPQDNLKTAVDEAATAVGGLGPDLRRFIDGSTKLAIDAHANVDSLTSLIDQVAPVLNTQTDTRGSVAAWAAHLDRVTDQLRRNDTALRGVLTKAPPALREVEQLFDRLHLTLPVVLANLVSIGNVAVAYRADLEQLLVLLPQTAATQQAIGVANRDTKQDLKGAFLSFNLNLNLPPPCTTGFLPAQQRRTPVNVDAPDRPAGDLYCRLPQDSVFNVRGARNIPCEARPGKRAPTWQMCESDEQYVPLNEGYSWKGDPNGTLSGQDVPQHPPTAPAADVRSQGPAAPPVPALAVAAYDPATGTYVGPDGKTYTQADLAQLAPKERTWQSMLMPPGK